MISTSSDDDQQDICPNYGVHKYFVSGKTYTDFSPYQATSLYERKEYAIMSCNCGDTFRQAIRDK